MRHTDVLKAEAEAARFLLAADEYKHAYDETAKIRQTNHPGILEMTPLVERAALRRASLDLSRALAKMRRRG